MTTLEVRHSSSGMPDLRVTSQRLSENAAHGPGMD